MIAHTTVHIIEKMRGFFYFKLSRNGTDWNECEFARRFAQVEADENSHTHTHVLLKVVGL